MSNFYKPFATAEGAVPVSFAMVNDSAYADSTLEPGMVRIRESNSARVYVSSVDSTAPGVAPVSCTVSSPDDAILLQRIKRIGVNVAAIHHDTPVINNSNNVILCYDVTLNRVFTFTLETGDYNTPQLLITALQTAKTASGLPTQFQYTFNGAIPPAYLARKGPKTDSSVLLVTSAPILFLPSSSGVKFGRSTFGWKIPNVNIPEWDGINPVNPTLQAIYTANAVTEQMIGPMKCVYTQYADIFSRTLTKWAKVNNISTTLVNQNLLYRIYFPDFDGYPTNPGVILILDDRVPPQVPTAIIYKQSIHEVANASMNPVYMTINPRESIVAIDFELKDEYGKPFETNDKVYSQTSGAVISLRSAADTIEKPIDEINGVNTGGLSWNLHIYTEL